MVPKLSDFLMAVGFSIILGFPGHLAIGQVQWQFQNNCDIPGSSLESLKKSSKIECQAACEGQEKCRAFVYVTGWQRCFLKEQGVKKATIRFVSGDLSADKNRSFEASKMKMDHDHTGKDLGQVVLDQADACGLACQARSDCHAFTYIEGYRVCWLKAAGGRLIEKVFQCGVIKS